MRNSNLFIILWGAMSMACPVFLHALDTVVIEGRVAEMIDDAPVPVEGAIITAIHDTSVRTVSDADGAFRFTELLNMGTGYVFYITKEGYYYAVAYWNKDLSDVFPDSDFLEVRLLPVDSEWPTISGRVTMADGSDLNRVWYVMKDENDIPIPDPYGWLLGGLVDPETGRYDFPVPPHLHDRPSFVVEAYKWPLENYIWGAYPDGTRFGQRIARSGNTNADITLYPVTVISIVAEPLDSDGSGRFDRVRVEVAAHAGDHYGRFNGSPDEIIVIDEEGNDIHDPVFNGIDAWSFEHPAYENFGFHVYADVSHNHDVNSGYHRHVFREYVKSSSPPLRAVVEHPDLHGFTLESPSGTSSVYLPPAGLTGLYPRDEIIVEITEIDPRQAGATHVTGSDILVVHMLDPLGNPVYQGGGLEIRMPFDTETVLPGTIEETGRYAIFRTKSTLDLIEGQFMEIFDTNRIVQIDRLEGVITFRTHSLGAFGIGAPPSPVEPVIPRDPDDGRDPGDSNDDGQPRPPVIEEPFEGSARSETSCFISSMAAHSPLWRLFLFFLPLAATSTRVLIKQRRTGPASCGCDAPRDG